MKYFVFLLTAFILLSIMVQAQDDDDTITIDSSLVVLNASITDAKGNPVTNLKQNQFKVFEDGIEQEISLFSATETPFAAVILLDTSGSMETRISLARSAAITFLDGLDSDDVAAIYNFDSKVSILQDFSNSRDVADKVFDLKAYGMTVLNDAVFKAADELSKRPEKRRAIIVLSDGADTKSGKSAEKALKAALAADVMIYTVDMSALDTGGKERAQNQGVLKNFAEKTGGFFVATPGGQAMRDAFKKIVSELGTQYTLGYQPTNLKKDGKWRALELRVQRPNLTIRTRKGYNAPKK
ncbi:MAG TPA: VWA domain-containing protein [Pyrinomonadaceae bacterium]|nr:VWA domain-containing protein [Pyrinomonadaceae bacterium]